MTIKSTPLPFCLVNSGFDSSRMGRNYPRMLIFAAVSPF